MSSSFKVGLPSLRSGRAGYRVRGSFLEQAPSGSEAEPAAILILEQLSQEFASPEELRRRHGLTRQEAAVALMLAKRKRNGEIAETLSISPHTARRHTQSVLDKLGVRSRDAVAQAVLAGESL